ncbi:hypothetical protein AGABI2DRAFT_64306, partial [Agaricus bisporus var. bisporus H97]|uniref:hypothetical protein n=1 Tax=Agaricus bisporus var. bisporus (strain H97 / ATCC MYA-4626 / FGSC 10389) TaxID=936046 RepID=UPI00029F6DA4
VARKIPFEDPVVLGYVRIAYITAQVVILATHYYVSIAIKRENDQTVLNFSRCPNGAQPSRRSCLPLSPHRSQEHGKLVSTTVNDYDLTEVSKLLRSAYMGIVMMAVIHGYFKFTQPLFVQALLGVKGIYDVERVTICLLGKPATGNFKRPFTSQGIVGVCSSSLSYG